MTQSLGIFLNFQTKNLLHFLITETESKSYAILIMHEIVDCFSSQLIIKVIRKLITSGWCCCTKMICQNNANNVLCSDSIYGLPLLLFFATLLHATQCLPVGTKRTIECLM